MTVALVGTASIAAFVLAFARSGLIVLCGRALDEAKAAGAAMRDTGLDDIEKERIAQQASLRLFGFFGGILLRALAVLAISFVPILLADLLSVAAIRTVTAWLAQLDVVLTATVVIAAGYLMASKLWPRT